MSESSLWFQAAAYKLQEFWIFLQTGTALSEWIQFAIILFIGTSIAFVTYLFCKILFGKFLRRFIWINPQRAIRLVNFFLLWLIIIHFLDRALDVFKKMPSWLWQWKTDIVPWAYGLAIFIGAMKMIDFIVEACKQSWQKRHAGIDEAIAIFLGRIIKVILFVIVMMVVLDNLGIKVIGLITGLGFVGAALALASQNTIANGIGYFEILLDRLFKVGDLIACGDWQGFVSNIGLRSVQIRSIYGEKINLPNKDLVDKQIRNFTRGKAHRLSIKLAIAYKNENNSIENILQVLRAALTSISFIEDYDVIFKQLTHGSLDLEVFFWAAFHTESEYNRILTEVNLLIKENFDRKGVSFAVPTHTLYIKNSDEQKLRA